MILADKIKQQNGAAAVEFALILPVMILIIFGIIEFGLFLYNKHVITNASREGARAGVVARYNSFTTLSDDPVKIADIVDNWCADHLVTFGAANDPVTTVLCHCVDVSGNYEADLVDCYSSGNPCSNVSDYEPCRVFACPLTVTVQYNYGFLVLSNIGISPITLEAKTVMNMEEPM